VKCKLKIGAKRPGAHPPVGLLGYNEAKVNKEEFIKRSAQIAANAYTYSFSEMMEQRARQSYATRLAKVCYGKSTRHLLANTINLPPDVYGLLAAGGQQIVYATDSKVAKIITHSLTFDKQKAEGHAEWYEEHYDRVIPYVAEHIVETDFDVRRFRGGLFAAIALQPRIRAIKEFQDVDDMVTYRDDDAYIDELRSLFDELTDLYNNTAMRLDLNGPRNIFLEAEEEPHIRIVDTIVVSPEIQALEDQSRVITIGQALAEKMNIIEEVVSRQPATV
jgi:hypothetical protein